VKFGELRHPVTIQRRYVGQTDGGERTEAWVDEARTFAKIKPAALFAQSFAYLGAEAEQSDVSHGITIRARPGAKPVPFESRAMLGDREFKILAVVEEDERGEAWMLLCREVDA
jgi:head-tail adaptor